MPLFQKQKSAQISLRSNPTERAQIHAAAQARGVSASELIREGLRLQGVLPDKQA
jgi:predicted HicB family RNase H-like nuclease